MFGFSLCFPIPALYLELLLLVIFSDEFSNRNINLVPIWIKIILYNGSPICLD